MNVSWVGCREYKQWETAMTLVQVGTSQWVAKSQPHQMLRDPPNLHSPGQTAEWNPS